MKHTLNQEKGCLEIVLQKEEPAELLALLEQFFQKTSDEDHHRYNLRRITEILQGHTDLHEDANIEIYQFETLSLEPMTKSVLSSTELQGNLLAKLTGLLIELTPYLRNRPFPPETE